MIVWSRWRWLFKVDMSDRGCVEWVQVAKKVDMSDSDCV